MKKASANMPRISPPTPCDELQASAGMPPDVREYVVAKLSEILVLDYQLFQEVPRPTVVEGSACNRRLRGGMANAASAGPSAHDDTRRSSFMHRRL